jgi:hypothetical protein
MAALRLVRALTMAHKAVTLVAGALLLGLPELLRLRLAS